MRYPALNDIGTQRLMTENFLGLDRRPRAYDGAFFDMENMQGEPSPLISTRRRRGLVTTLTSPRAMIAAGALCYIDGETLYVGGEATPIDDLSEDESMLPKEMVVMGAYVLIFPDGAYYNTVDPSDYGRIDQENSAITATVYPWMMDGLQPVDMEISATEPEAPANGDYWLDTGGDIDTIKCWDGDAEQWNVMATTYVKIEGQDIGVGLKTGDAITTSGIAYDGEDEKMQRQWEALNGSFIIEYRDEDYIILTGVIDKGGNNDGTLTAARKMPKMRHIIECNNRLWGCFHGESGGATLNEIYASALGDFKNWRIYTSQSQASYTVSVGTDGDFTGAVNHRGQPLFFKERCLHKIFGDKPSNFQMQTTILDGVRENCGNSLQVVGGTLFYLGLNGPCAFETLPTDMGQALGTERYKNGAAGEYGNKYYISMEGDSGHDLYVLNTVTGLWHKEDHKHITHFARIRDELYMLEDNGNIWAVNGTEGEEEGEINFRIDSAKFGFEYPDNKYIYRFDIRMKLGARAECKLYIQYDSDGTWHYKGRMDGKGRIRTFVLPAVPRRCDHMQYRLEGKGEIEIYSVARLLSVGADGQGRK